MTHHKVILSILEDGLDHCGNEFRKVYIGEYRSRINELRHKGYVIKGESCNLKHYHEGRVPNMWKLEGFLPEAKKALNSVRQEILRESTQNLARGQMARKNDTFSGSQEKLFAFYGFPDH